MRDISLRQRAIEALSRREHSRWELQRKLARYAIDGEELDAVLANLQKEGLLSDHRFAESLAHRRSERYGTRRIELEFEQHGLPPEAVGDQLKSLADSEWERCQSVWKKKFGHCPHDITERGRQIRFLASRGFAMDVIHKVINSDEMPD